MTSTSPISLQYQLNGQIMSILNEQDFAKAIHNHATKSLPLKLYINTDNSLLEEPPSEQEINDMFQLLRDQGYVEPAEDTNPIFVNQTGFNHDVECHLCNKLIIGTRWKCTVCSAVDLCNECEPNHDESHPLIRITEQLPSGFNSTAFSLCHGLYKFDEKIQQISEAKSNISTVYSSAAQNAKQEISSVINMISSQMVEGSKNLTHELEDFVGDASKVVEHIPRRLKDVRSRLSGMISSCSGSFNDLRGTLLREEKSSVEQFAAQHKALEEMGFSNRQRNENLLVQFNGNVEVCVENLISTPDQ
eukprot:TRINITY_DN8285_c0_g1_i1.p1 TRINITY_DN8285_c0_g1~~TRINITY_DN8285_c0_g1_i1.p1  ORF type:complete len:339 (-),score=44.58 TRINITY_DN8285_c0_g1_i1:1-912(-)